MATTDWTDVYPYSLLSEDPTTSTYICWVDDSGNGGGSQSVDVGASTFTDSAPEEVPFLTGVYRYSVLVDGLSPDTVYSVTVNSSSTVSTEIKTLPTTQPATLDIGITSDHHPWRSSGMIEVAGGPGPMEAMGDLNHDLLLSMGDIVSWAWQNTDSTDASRWVQWISDYLGPLNASRLVPMLMVPGNHDVGNHHWDPETDSPVSGDAGFFRFFMVNITDIPPLGESYGQITIGDYLQLIGLDTHSGDVVGQTSWIQNNHDPTVEWCIPIYHYGSMPGSDRDDGTGNSYAMHAYLRENWNPIWADAENIRCTFCGNEHCRKVTYPFLVQDTEPSGNYWTTANGRYLTVDTSEPTGDPLTAREFGDGWMASYSGPHPEGDWFLSTRVNGAEEQYYHLTLSETSAEVSQYDMNGAELASHTFDVPESSTTASEHLRYGDQWVA